jgi:hypothetical protein
MIQAAWHEHMRRDDQANGEYRVGRRIVFSISSRSGVSAITNACQAVFLSAAALTSARSFKSLYAHK